METLKSPVTPCPVPSPSILEGSLSRVHYRDAFASGFESDADLTVDDAFRAFFRTAPKTVSALFRLRNRIVRRLGLKAPEEPDSARLDTLPLERGTTVGLFRIYAKGPGEILAGEDDKHLDFRVLIRLEREPGNRHYRLLVATVVDLKNALGRMYFAPVRVFHRWIVPAMVRAMVKGLAAAAAGAPARQNVTG
jgi:hypothetical protein